MKKLFEKWFCKHKWKTHFKEMKVTTYQQGGSKEMFVEILICEHCGKIQKLEY